MAWEVIADFKSDDPKRKRWRDLALAITSKLVELEPALQFRIRNLPSDGKPKSVFPPLGAMDVPESLREKLEAPDPKLSWIRQYRCKDCLNKEGNPSWVPQMYLALHKGHDLIKGEPTARNEIPAWQPNYRLFIGGPDRLKDFSGRMYSVVLTTVPKSPKDLAAYDVLFFLPTSAVVDEKAIRRAANVEEVHQLPGDPVEATKALLKHMIAMDKNALSPDPDDDPTEDAEAVAIRRMQAAERFLEGKMREVMPKGEKSK